MTILSKKTLKKHLFLSLLGCKMNARTNFKVAKTIRQLILVSFVTLFTISPLLPRFWMVKNSLIQHSSFTARGGWDLVPLQSTLEFDLGIPSDCVTYENQKVTIHDCLTPTNLKWKSDDTWKVTEVIPSDLNHDGKTELAMVVWRPFKPWPIDSFMPNGGRIENFHDRHGFSCHVILVGWDGNGYREMWAGSALVDPVSQIRVFDIDGDGYHELIALEEKYNSLTGTGNLTVWEWSGFGFRLMDRIAGHFSQYGILVKNSDVLILTN